MLLSTLALLLLSGSAVAQFPFTGEHETVECPVVNRATGETPTIEIRKLRYETGQDTAPLSNTTSS